MKKNEIKQRLQVMDETCQKVTEALESFMVDGDIDYCEDMLTEAMVDDMAGYIRGALAGERMGLFEEFEGYLETGELIGAEQPIMWEIYDIMGLKRMLIQLSLMDGIDYLKSVESLIKDENDYRKDRVYLMLWDMNEFREIKLTKDEEKKIQTAMDRIVKGSIK